MNILQIIGTGSIMLGGFLLIARIEYLLKHVGKGEGLEKEELLLERKTSKAAVILYCIFMLIGLALVVLN